MIYNVFGGMLNSTRITNRIGGYDSNRITAYSFTCSVPIATICGFFWFLKQYCTIAPTVLASVYALAT